MRRAIGITLVGSLAFACGGTTTTVSPETPKTPEAAQSPDELEPASAAGPSTWSFASWDVDQNDQLDEEEFTSSWSDIYTEWDEDGDQLLTDVEVSAGMMAAWDTNFDGRLDADEFAKGARFWFGDNWDHAGFRDWDGDGDGELTLTEWTAGSEKVRYYNDLDENEDGYLDQKELVGGFWTAWDPDRDGVIEVREWGFTDY